MDISNYLTDDQIDFKKEFYRYFSFWKLFLLSILIFLFIGFIYLRYVNYEFRSTAIIQILDKSQDSEMALPTAMTVFNRSMVNLENEIGVLSSFNIHKNVVKELSSNIKLYSVGRVKTAENHKSDWYDDYELSLKPEINSANYYYSYFKISNENNLLKIEYFDQNDILQDSFSFKENSTNTLNHTLPFELTIRKDISKNVRLLRIFPLDNITEYYRSNVNVIVTGKESDLLNVSLDYPNRLVSDDYLNALISEFDKDGVRDRQLEYKRTMDFVDSRSKFLLKELEQVELKRQEFKEDNNLTNIESDATISASQQFNYDSDLFKAKSQKDLLNLLLSTLDENKFELIPVNIGLESGDINKLISEYNLLINERNRFLLSAGKNSPYVTNIENKLNSFFKNIVVSISNFNKSLDLNILNLGLKEKEFAEIYQTIPENEKILRTIERELEVKEALFVLLLQKREEAAINYAVVKPSIKIIDYSRSSVNPIRPNKIFIYTSSFLFGLFLPFLILYFRFLFDNKIHTKEQLNKIIGDNNIPVVGEIPYNPNQNDLKNIIESSSRGPIAESLRIVIANLNFVLFDENNIKKNLILVTSSIKGEGKTIVSINTSAILASKYKKVLLIGADLRNPQIHKYLNIDKNINGLSDFIYKKDSNWNDYLVKHENLDILCSGSIPPNPTELLASEKFKNFIEEVKSKYDFVIIDSAPCLLVSDTLEISKYVDTTLYVVRSNFTEEKVCEFIVSAKNSSKLKAVNLVLNGVGNSASYGYKYGYQYGYQYGYRYGYNYGYGYGYDEDKS